MSKNKQKTEVDIFSKVWKKGHIMSIDIELLEDLSSNDNPIRDAFAMHDEHLKPLAGKFIVTAISPFSIEKREKMTMDNIRKNLTGLIEDGLLNPQL